MVRILLCMDTSTEYNRAIIRGIISYSQTHDNCLLLSRVPSCLLAESPERKDKIEQWIKDWGINAIIVGLLSYDDLLPLSNLDISVVLQNTSVQPERISTINEEYIITGQIAADFFINKKYINYAYFGLKNIYWSEERARGFRNEVRRHNVTYNEYMVETNTIDEESKITKWLTSLQKPVAIFCCNDKHALVISELCHIAKIDVPQEVSILGVDNDELICNVSNPPLSSLTLNVENAGYETGHLLHSLENIESKSSFVVSIKPGIVVQRGSTQKHNVKDKEVSKMLEYIDANYTHSISTKDVFSQAFLCRRAAEIRFKEMTDMTVYKYLTEQRLNHLCALMETTNLSLAECASRSGISSLNYLFHLFKKNFGCSPNEWRKSRRKKS